jgi:hypothetical protein
MNKTIEKLEKEIEYLKTKQEQVKEENQLLYKNGFEDLRDNQLFQDNYKYKHLREELERNLEFYVALEKEGIDIDKQYFLTDNIYLSFWHNNGCLFTSFGIKDGGWIYDNFINSWSGINEWINDLINEEYSLFSGNSSYCHAWNTMSMKEIFNIIEDKEHKIDIDRKVKLVKNLIEFTKENGQFKDIRKSVVEMLEFRFNKMKENIEDDIIF